MDKNTDVIIIGGGIIGLACAHYLLEHNASVRIIEQDVIGSGASHGNCGLLHFSGILPLCSPGVVKHEMHRAIRGTSPLYIKPTLDISRIQWLLKFAAHCNTAHLDAATVSKNEILRYSLGLYERLFSENSLDCDFEKKGILYLFKDQEYFDKYGTTNARLEKYDFGARPMDAAAVCSLEPAVRDDIAGAWYNENDWHVRPDMLLKSWKDLLIKRGLIIEEQCRVNELAIETGSIRHVNTGKGQYKADTFVLATGSWTPEMNKQLKLNIPVQPGKGYSITMARPDRSPNIPCLLYERNMVATPWSTGYRLGGTMEFSGHNRILYKKRLAKLIDGAGEYLDTKMDHPVLEEWSGLRPMTYDDLPIIDRSPHQENLFVATGLGMLGLTMATGTGQTVSDMVFGRKPQINLAPFSLGRF